MPTMLRSWPQWFVLAVPAALVALASLPSAQAQLGGAFPVIPVSPNTAAEADPIPLRRVVVAPERVLTELERARQGVLVQLPRAEFEQRVRQAARTEEALKKPPRLLQARYQASLSGIALVGTRYCGDSGSR